MCVVVLLLVLLLSVTPRDDRRRGAVVRGGPGEREILGSLPAVPGSGYP